MPRRIDGPDWSFVDWHYGFLWRRANLHNRLLPVRMKGQANLPSSGAFLYAANHFTYWDPILLQSSIGRPVNWLAKKEIMDNAFGKWFFGRGGCIPVDRKAGGNVEAVRAAIDALGAGRVVGVFPEGGRGDGSALREPKSGVARLAMASGAPVVPAAVLTDRFWPRSRKLPKLGEPVYLNVGEPVKYEGDPEDTTATREAARDVMRRVAALLDEARAARAAGEKWPRP